MSERITIKKPYISHGPRGMTADEATAHYLEEIQRKIEQGHIVVGGFNVTIGVIDLLSSVSYALRASESECTVQTIDVALETGADDATQS